MTAIILLLLATLLGALLAPSNAEIETKLPDPNFNVQLQIALLPKAGGLDNLHSTILAVSSPKSPTFRQVRYSF